MCSIKCICSDSGALAGAGAGAVRNVHCAVCIVHCTACQRQKIRQSKQDELNKKKNTLRAIFFFKPIAPVYF